ncbi:hybrid sensor histidine kinase/response regulator [Roseateles sp.]|uniref:hybrid sensor histidine kinase/response regulator n=1 Tax=Roseateles sp. TaxID=1971397 RepID=UPI002E082FBE|nr:ATP-binding protein [Roseateles sp.]
MAGWVAGRLVAWPQRLWLFLLLWLAPLGAFAGPARPDIGAPQDRVEDVALFIDESDAATIETIQARAFQPAKPDLFIGNQSHPVWLRVRLRAAPEGTRWQLSLWPPFIHEATLYQARDAGPWQSTTIGSRHAYVDRPIGSLGLAFPLVVRPEAEATVFIRLRTPTPVATVEVVQPEQLVAQEQLVLAVFAAFIGAVPLLLLTSVVAWWVTGVRIWLVFAGFDLMTTLSVALQSGLAARFVWPHAEGLLDQLHPVGVFGQVFFAAAVFVQFCQFIGAPKWLERGFLAAMAALPLNLALLAAGQLVLALRLNNLTAIFLVVLSFLLVFVPNRGDRIVGLAVKVAGGFSAVFHGMFFLPWMPFVEREHGYLFMRFSTMPTVFVTACITLTIALRQTQLAMRERQLLQAKALEAERQRTAALEASEAKSAFLAYMSHEIRNPLHAVMGLADLARDPDLPEGVRREHLQMLSASAHLLSHTISEVLDFSKIESGKMRADGVPFDLDALLASVFAVHLPLARQKGLDLRLTPTPTACGWVRGDPGRLRQILGNFLSNALKFTDTGDVTLTVSHDEAQLWRFEVRDSGQGMSAQETARLFSPYVQAGGVAERSMGTGLGLAISRELARLMGGDVGVHSEPGRGSRFWVDLPLPQAVAAGPAEPLAADGLPGEAKGEKKGEVKGEASGSMAGRRILVADDVASNRTLMDGWLRRQGAQPTTVRDGAEAVEAVSQAFGRGQPFDLVLLDVHMPVMDGLEATRRIRALGPAGTLPIVAVSGGVSVEERARAKEAGMDDFLAKPLSLRRLCDCVAELLPADTVAAPNDSTRRSASR